MKFDYEISHYHTSLDPEADTMWEYRIIGVKESDESYPSEEEAIEAAKKEMEILADERL